MWWTMAYETESMNGDTNGYAYVSVCVLHAWMFMKISKTVSLT